MHALISSFKKARGLAHACCLADTHASTYNQRNCVMSPEVYLRMLYYRLLTCILTFISSTYKHISTYMQA